MLDEGGLYRRWARAIRQGRLGNVLAELMTHQEHLGVPPQDDRNITKRWCELGEEYKLDMVLCVAAAQRRGLLDEDEARRAGKDTDNMAPGFNMSGRGQLIDAGIQADRLMVFGD